jgi:hypothetical protein
MCGSPDVPTPQPAPKPAPLPPPPPPPEKKEAIQEASAPKKKATGRKSLTIKKQNSVGGGSNTGAGGGLNT